MQEIRFTRAAPWRCPSYKDYYIQDRPTGKDIYGNDTYGYALFKMKPFQVIRRFRTRKQAYEYVSRITVLEQWHVKMGSHSIIVNDHDYLGVIYGKSMYRISKRTCEVATRPVEDEQLSGWFMKYVECLNYAKELIKDMEDKELC